MCFTVLLESRYLTTVSSLPRQVATPNTFSTSLTVQGDMPGGGDELGRAQGRRTGGRGGWGIPQLYGPRGRSGLQLPTLVRGRPPCQSRGLRQDHQLEQAAQGGPGAHLGALVTAPRRFLRVTQPTHCGNPCDMLSMKSHRIVTETTMNACQPHTHSHSVYPRGANSQHAFTIEVQSRISIVKACRTHSGD